MAGASLTSFIKWTVDKLSSMVEHVSGHPVSSVQELQNLETTMRWIHDTLDDAEGRDITEKAELLRLRELKDVAYDAEDVVDEYEYEVLRVEVEARRLAMDRHKGIKNDEVLDQKPYHVKVPISYELTRRVREIRERFTEITTGWEHISLQEKDGKKRRVKKWQPVESTSFYDKDTTFGREEEKRKIMEWLLQGTKSSDVKVSVLPIVGMGGLGKTKVAQMVYNDPMVHQKFHFRGWVCVSEDFDVAGLTRKILIAFTSMGLDDHLTLDELYRILREILEGKRFLLILDDVWNENTELWDSLKSFLVGAGVGKIIVTTRNERVARIMRTNPPIYLSNLSFENCWLLFTKIAFEARDHDLHRVIGKEIVKKCKGLPLAVKVLASILSTEDDDETWYNILQSELWELEEEKDGILPALKLSYNRMPTELRPCFMYLSLFPKDTRLYRPNIVQLWMSQGFLQSEESMTEEDVGNAYVNELLHRSFLQYDNRAADEAGFIMHDLIHDLAQSISRDEHLLVTTDELHPIPRTCRHVSVYFKDNFEIVNLQSFFQSKLQTSRLRTVILHRANGFSISEIFLNLKCVRTLVLVMKERMLLPDSIGNLKHLRYLKISDVESTPQSLYKLYRLQTLNYENFRPGIKLSKGVGDLVNLRHLRGHSQHCLHKEVTGLTSLQTLERFHVGDDSSQCKVNHLKDLSNLRGKLRVAGLQTVRWSDITPVDAYLKSSRGIESLSLQWDSRGRLEEKNVKLAEQVLNCLQPHANLRELRIVGCPGAMFPAWLGDSSFSELQELELLDCNFLSLPPLGLLRSLKELRVGRLRKVRSVGREFLCPVNPAAGSAKEGPKRSSCCFPSLELLRFMEMDEWEEWNDVEVCDFPCLRRLHVYKCAKLQRLPSLSSLVTLNVRLCPKLRTLPSLPSVTELELWGRIDLLSCCCLTTPLRSLNIHWYEGASLLLSDYRILDSLENLAIVDCSNLRSLSGLGNIKTLQNLVIKGYSELRLLPDDHLPCNIRRMTICPVISRILTSTTSPGELESGTKIRFLSSPNAQLICSASVGETRAGTSGPQACCATWASSGPVVFFEKSV